ncbi:MAG: hypothetical protein QG644_354, partial [Patescibacteria group bacterium]|nr:hypothetical protein [Patescibacteria group bacterium]
SSSYTFPSSGTYSVRACADNNASFVGAITEGNEGNNCSAWRDVSVSVAIPSPQIIYFTASPSTLDLGESSTLSWHSTSTDSCTGTNFSTGSTSPVTGTAVVTPLAEGVSSYTLTCVNNTLGQFASDSTSVTVSIIVKKPVIKEN